MRSSYSSKVESSCSKPALWVPQIFHTGLAVVGIPVSGARDVPAWHDIDLQNWIGGRHVRRGQPELTPHDVAALRDRARLVECDLAVAALTAEAAVARNDQAHARDVLQRHTHLGSYLLRTIGMKLPVSRLAEQSLLFEID